MAPRTTLLAEVDDVSLHVSLARWHSLLTAPSRMLGAVVGAGHGRLPAMCNVNTCWTWTTTCTPWRRRCRVGGFGQHADDGLLLLFSRWGSSPAAIRRGYAIPQFGLHDEVDDSVHKVQSRFRLACTKGRVVPRLVDCISLLPWRPSEFLMPDLSIDLCRRGLAF